MKRVRFFLAMALAVCVVATSSCKKDKNKDKEVPSLSINPSQTEVKFKADGSADGNATFTVTTNQTTWEVEASEDWVTVEKTGNSFTVSATPQSVDAVATVTVSANGAEDIVINLTLEGRFGVEINGIVWAKRNVDAVGTFAATPEALGKFYQWNRKVAWAASGDVTGWDYTGAEGDSWTEANDPSPEGWRVPTHEEVKSLYDDAKVSNEWTVQNGVNGRLFTDKATNATLFLPAAVYRDYSDGTLIDAETGGTYWSSTANGTTGAFYLGFDSGNAFTYGINRGYGLSVRSVAE